MSLFGYADFERPIDLQAGQLFHPFGGGPFWLAPRGCQVASRDDRQLDFRLDLIRSLTGGAGQRALLEVEIAADYATDAALARVRQERPDAVLTRSVLTDWTFRLLPGPSATDQLRDLLRPVPLASNDFGAARLLLQMPIEGGLLLESMLTQEGTSLGGVAEAQLPGVSPRVPAVVRFTSSSLLPPLLALADGQGLLPRRLIAEFFLRDLVELPLELTGDLQPARRAAFAETMTDRLVARFGRYVASGAPTFEPWVVLDRLNGEGLIDVRWSLSQPFLASRRVALPFDLLSGVRQNARDLGLGAFVHRQTLTSLPSLGQTRVTTLCNLPAERIGVESLGVTLSFAPRLPARPQTKRATLTFVPPEDIGHCDVMLSPGESLAYTFSTFAVVADEHGVRQLHGPVVAHSGSLLRLSPGDFPLDFFLIEVTGELAAQASIDGRCDYDVQERRYSVPFRLDSGRTSVSVALPRQRASASVSCTLVARDGLGVLELGPFETPRVRLDLTSLASYGPQQAHIEAGFEHNAAFLGVDLLPFGESESSAALTTVVLTPAEPRHTHTWFSRSPFRCGFRYRLHQADGNRGDWREFRQSGERLMLVASELRAPQTESAVIARSAGAAVRERGRLDLPRRETAAAAGEPPTALPVSPQPRPTDELLYSRPEDAAKKLYLPRYSLDVESVSGRRRYRVAMTERQGVASLTVGLVGGPAESLVEAARDAEQLPHEIAVVLEYLVAPPAGVRKTLAFDEITRSGNLVTARLDFASLEERDEMFLALTEASRQAHLTVQRSFAVSVPTPVRPDFGLKTPYLRRKLTLSTNLVDAALRASVLAPAPKPVLSAVAVPMLVSTQVRLRNEAQQLLKSRALNPAIMSDVVLSNVLKTKPLLSPIGVFVRALPIPELAFVGQEAGPKFTKCSLAITNWAAFPDELFASASDLPPCGAITVASRTWLDVYDADNNNRLHGFGAISSQEQLSNLSFPIPTGSPLPRRLYVKLLDRRTKATCESKPVDTGFTQQVEPPHRDVHEQLDQVVAPDPLVFSPTLHPYIFEGIVPPTGGNQLIRFRLTWKGMIHTYFQDAARRDVVYYLPDQLKIARQQEPPFTPLAAVRIGKRAGSEETQVVFDYLVAPHTSPRRLADAETQLLADPHFGAARVAFQPFITSEVRLFIDRPAVGGAVREERPDGALVLRGGLKDTLTLTLADFQLLFDAMNRNTAALFTGRIEVQIPNDDPELIPFIARMDDLEGELFIYEARAQSNGDVDVTLTNAIESPVRINTLDLSVDRGNQACKGSLPSGVLPVAELGPAQSIRATVTPERALAGDGPLQLSFALEGVEVRPDPVAIWDAILDRSMVEYSTTVTVRAAPVLFQPIAGRDNERIVVVLLEFQGGGTAQLSSAALVASVRIDHAIDDVILRRPIDGAFSYVLTVVRADGSQQRESEPRHETAPDFWVAVNK